MTKIISQQYKEAQKNYSENIKQISQNEFSVTFDQSNSFTISLPTNYPSSPPRVLRGKLEFLTPMTRNWNSLFTLNHLIEHLEICSSIPLPEHLELNKSEITNAIKKSKSDAINTKEGRNQILKSSSSPTTKKALEQINSLSGKIEKEQKNVRNLSKDISNNSSSSAPQVQQVQNKENAIQMYRAEARKIDSDVSDMKDDIQISQFQKSKQNLIDLYERMYLLEGTAQLLEDRADL